MTSFISQPQTHGLFPINILAKEGSDAKTKEGTVWRRLSLRLSVSIRVSPQKASSVKVARTLLLRSSSVSLVENSRPGKFVMRFCDKSRLINVEMCDIEAGTEVKKLWCKFNFEIPMFPKTGAKESMTDWPRRVSDNSERFGMSSNESGSTTRYSFPSSNLTRLVVPLKVPR